MQVYVKNRAGQIGTIDSEVAKANPLDYFPVSEDEVAKEQQLAEHETAGQQVIAGAEGVVRGATLGGSDWILNKLMGDAYSAGATRRREANPTLTTATEIVGGVAPILATGGGGAAATGARGALTGAARYTPAALAARAGHAVGHAVGATRLGKVGALAAEGIVEGTAFGVGEAISEASLGNTDLTAQALLAGAGHGALFGGVVGGGLGVAASAVGKASGAARRAFDGGLPSLRKLAGEAGGESLESAAQQLKRESMVKATGARGTDIRNLGTQAKVDAMGDVLSEYRLKDGRAIVETLDSVDDVLPKLQQAEREVGEVIGDLRRKASEAVKDLPIAKRIDRVQVQEAIDRIDDQVLNPLRMSGSRSQRAKAKMIESEFLGTMRKRVEEGRGYSIDELVQLRREVDEVVYPPKAPGQGIAVAAKHADELGKANRILEDFITTETDNVLSATGSAELQGAYLKAKQTWGVLRDARKMAEKADLQNLGNRWASPSDYYVGGVGATIGAMAAGPVGGLVGGAVGSMVNKVVRERGRSTVARIAERFAGVDAKIETKLSQYIARTSKDPVLDVAAAALVAGGKAAKRATKGGVITGEKAAHRVDANKAREAKTQQFGATSTARRATYERHTDTIREITTNPAAAQRRLEQTIDGLSPAVAIAVGATMMRGAEYLAGKAPAGAVKENSLTPHLERPFVSDTEVARYFDAVGVVQDPLSVLDHLEDGTLNRTHVEALRTVYPDLYGRVQEIALRELADTTAPPSYSSTLQLSLLLDLPGHYTLEPEFIRTMQASFTQEQEQPRAAARAPNLAGKVAAGTEAMEARMAGLGS